MLNYIYSIRKAIYNNNNYFSIPSLSTLSSDDNRNLVFRVALHLVWRGKMGRWSQKVGMWWGRGSWWNVLRTRNVSLLSITNNVGSFWRGAISSTTTAMERWVLYLFFFFLQFLARHILSTPCFYFSFHSISNLPLPDCSLIICKKKVGSISGWKEKGFFL